MNWNGAIYTYVHNYQGDIIAILDSAGSAVVEYYYDAWGRQYSASGTMADTLGKLNPFRYRGYVYDEETGLYYLRSRYYNPEWGRFINADVVLGKRGALLSHNLFAYCANAPVLFKDDYGYAMVCAFDDCGFGNSAASLTSISMSGGGGGVWNVYAYADSTHRRGGQSIEKEYLAVCEGISVFAKIAVTGYIAWKIGAVAGLLGQGIFDEAILQGFGAVIGRGMQAMTMASGAVISIGINEAIGTIVWNEESEPMTWMKLGREVAESFVPSVSGVVASRLKWSKKLTDSLEYWEGVFKEMIINAIYDD